MLREMRENLRLLGLFVLGVVPWALVAVFVWVVFIADPHPELQGLD